MPSISQPHLLLSHVRSHPTCPLSRSLTFFYLPSVLIQHALYLAASPSSMTRPFSSNMPSISQLHLLLSPVRSNPTCPLSRSLTFFYLPSVLIQHALYLAASPSSITRPFSSNMPSISQPHLLLSCVRSNPTCPLSHSLTFFYHASVLIQHALYLAASPSSITRPFSSNMPSISQPHLLLSCVRSNPTCPLSHSLTFFYHASVLIQHALYLTASPSSIMRPF